MNHKINLRYVFILFVLLIITTTFLMFKPLIAQKEKKSYVVFPIGKIVKNKGRTFVEVYKKYQAGLMGLENFNEVTVVYWFHKNDTPEKRSVLQVHPRGNPDNPLRGVFATHSPVRPNLIAISRCRIIAVRDNVVEIDGIDAFNNSPVLDLKN